jgi:hypothetical protein
MARAHLAYPKRDSYVRSFRLVHQHREGEVPYEVPRTKSYQAIAGHSTWLRTTSAVLKIKSKTPLRSS